MFLSSIIIWNQFKNHCITLIPPKSTSLVLINGDHEDIWGDFVNSICALLSEPHNNFNVIIRVEENETEMKGKRGAFSGSHIF